MKRYLFRASREIKRNSFNFSPSSFPLPLLILAEIGTAHLPLVDRSIEKVKFDVIYIGASAPHIPNSFFLIHLNPNVCALLPVDVSQKAQQLLLVERPSEARSITVREIARVRFVPLAL